MERGNVLVIGNSGVGKSTLINAVFGEEKAETGWGNSGTTKELKIFSSEKLPFRIIDTIGFEPSIIKEIKAINSVKKWSKESAKKGHEDNQINVIWFCVEGTSSKLFPKMIKELSRATSMWETVPVVVVITKSYSNPERERNIEMVNNAFAKQKRFAKNLSKVIPVVASTFVLNDSAFAPPEGIIELIDATNELMPEGIRACEQDIAKFKLGRKRALAHGITGACTAGATVVGAVPIPFPDALILSPIEIGLVNSLAKIYGMDNNEDTKKIINTIVEVGTIGVLAKNGINAIKAIPVVNIGASVANAIVAGSIVAVLGEGTIFAFEQIYLGKKSVTDLKWVKEVIESKYSSQFVDLVKKIMEKTNKDTSAKCVAPIIESVLKNRPENSKK